MPFFGLPTFDDSAADRQVVLAEFPRFVRSQAIAKGEEDELRVPRCARERRASWAEPIAAAHSPVYEVDGSSKIAKWLTVTPLIA